MLASTELWVNSFFLMYSIETHMFDGFTHVFKILSFSWVQLHALELVIKQHAMNPNSTSQVHLWVFHMHYSTNSNSLVLIASTCKTRALIRWVMLHCTKNIVMLLEISTTGFKFQMVRLSLESRKRVILLHSRGEKKIIADSTRFIQV